MKNDKIKELAIKLIFIIIIAAVFLGFLYITSLMNLPHLTNFVEEGLNYLSENFELIAIIILSFFTDSEKLLKKVSKR